MSAFGRPLATLILPLLIVFAILPMSTAYGARYAALVVEEQSGRVLYALNANARRHPASLTKMMTLYLLFDALDNGGLALDDRLFVSLRATRQSPTRLGLRKGDRIRVEDAVLALITKSANDVTTVVAEALADSESDFAQMMTRKARQLGLAGSVFRNASGLPDKSQLSTAKDMARLAQALRRDFPHYYPYFSKLSFSFRRRTIRGHNNLLKHYRGMDGIKTGYTRASGYNLVSAAERDGRRIIAVVFGGRSAWARDQRMRDLLNLGFRRLGAVPIPRSEKPIEILFAGRNKRFIDVPLPGEKPAPPRVITASRGSKGDNRPASAGGCPDGLNVGVGCLRSLPGSNGSS